MVGTSNLGSWNGHWGFGPWQSFWASEYLILLQSLYKKCFDSEICIYHPRTSTIRDVFVSDMHDFFKIL